MCFRLLKIRLYETSLNFSCSFIGGHHQKWTDKTSSDRCILNFIILFLKCIVQIQSANALTQVPQHFELVQIFCAIPTSLEHNTCIGLLKHNRQCSWLVVQPCSSSIYSLEKSGFSFGTYQHRFCSK